MSVFSDIGSVGSSALDTGLNMVTFGGYGASKAANAAQNMAEAQQAEQEKQQQQALGYADMTPDEMKTMQEQLDHLSKMNTIFGQQISNSATVLAAVNPAFITAGQNAVDMMNGKEAPTLAPLKSQIDQQRQTLQTQLAAMYGTGWASSSAGIEAMQRFEQGAQSTIANAQQSYLGTLLGSATQGASLNANEMNQGASEMSNMFTQAQGVMGNYNKLKVDALAAFNPTQFSGSNNLADLRSNSFFSQQGQYIDTLPIAFMSAMHGGTPQQTSGGAGGGGGGGGGGGANMMIPSSNSFTMPQLGSSAGIGGATG